MNELTVFQNEQYGEIRVVMDEKNEPWFVGKDVAEALGYSNSRDALLKHVDSRDKDDVAICDAIGREQSTVVINESGLYSLIMSSRLSNAREFQHWVTSEVLPSIRKHGVYATAAVIDNILADPDYGIRILEELKAERERNAALQPKAAYFDALVERNTLTGIRETAKELGIRPKEFTTYLLEHGYVYRDHKNKLQPFAAHVEGGLFVLKECKSDKNGWSGTQLMITPKGRETFRLLMPAAA